MISSRTGKEKSNEQKEQKKRRTN